MRRSDRPQALTRATAQHPRGRLHERHYAAPGSGTIVHGARTMHAFLRAQSRPGRIIDITIVHPYATVGEEELVALPVVTDTDKHFAEPGLGETRPCRCRSRSP